jgi:hypothetical protein
VGKDENAGQLKAVQKTLHSKLRATTGAALGLGAVCTPLLTARIFGIPLPYLTDYDAVLIAASLVLLMAVIARQRVKARISRLRSFEREVLEAMRLGATSDLQHTLDDLRDRAEAHSDLAAVLEEYQPRLRAYLETLLDKEARQMRAARIAQLCEEADQLVKNAIKRRHESNPNVRAKLELENALKHLRNLVEDADRQFEEAMEKRFLTAWARITRPGRKKLQEIRNQIKALEIALGKVSANAELITTENDYEQIKQIVDQRIGTAKRLAADAIPESHRNSFEPDHALSVGLISAALSVPVSVAMDLDRAGSVYDALRDVNGNYAQMTDLEIWHETLTMSPDSLVGLASLTKGSYFESLVESGFGGERFANFNHPDTDIMIDGVAYQIKATDSVTYVESVADHIPVIATTEVADDTGFIDGGYTDVELSDAVDIALGGSLIDIGDTILDGITTGIGGVGIVAIVRGAHAAWGQYRKNGSALGAFGVGIGTTASGVARTVVNFAEIGYKGAVFASKKVTDLASSDRKLVDDEQQRTKSAFSPSEYRTPFDSPSDNIIQISPQALFLGR